MEGKILEQYHLYPEFVKKVVSGYKRGKDILQGYHIKNTHILRYLYTLAISYCPKSMLNSLINRLISLGWSHVESRCAEVYKSHNYSWLERGGYIIPYPRMALEMGRDPKVIDKTEHIIVTAPYRIGSSLTDNVKFLSEWLNFIEDVKINYNAKISIDPLNIIKRYRKNSHMIREVLVRMGNLSYEPVVLFALYYAHYEDDIENLEAYISEIENKTYVVDVLWHEILRSLYKEEQMDLFKRYHKLILRIVDPEVYREFRGRLERVDRKMLRVIEETMKNNNM